MRTLGLGTAYVSWKNIPRVPQAELVAREQARIALERAELAKKANCPTCLDMKFLRQDLPLNHPNFGKAIPCPDCQGKAMSTKRLSELQSASQLEGDLLGANFDKIIIKQGENDGAVKAAKEAVANKCGWLTFHGDYGLGKSYLMAAMVNQAVANGVPAVYFTAPDLLDLLREGINGGDTVQGRLEQLKAVRVLAIDELDKINATDWANEKLFQLLNSRYNQIGEVLTVVAMNDNPAELWKSKGANGYLFSRMNDERAKMFRFSGSDKRGIYFKIKDFINKRLGGK